MADLFLLKVQKEKVFNSMKEMGLNPLDFRFSEVQSQLTSGLNVSKIFFKDSKYFFLFDFNRDEERWCQFSPGVEKMVEWEKSYDWESVGRIFIPWLESLITEINTDDPWEIFSKSQQLFESNTTEIENNAFTSEEIKLLAQKLDTIENHIISLQHSTVEEIKVIHENFTEIKKASNRIGKKDWTLLFLGNITSMLITKLITPENINSIIVFSANALQWIQKLPPKVFLPS